MSHKGLVSGQVAREGRHVLQGLTSRQQFGKAQLLDFLCDFFKIVTLEPSERVQLQNRLLLASAGGSIQRPPGGRSLVEGHVPS